MSLPIKITVGILGLSAIAIPGIWLVTTAEPNSTTLADANANDYTGKFGEDFRHHLVDAKEGKNQSWWDWSFKYRWQTDNGNERGDSFKDVSDGSSLREKCKEAYNKENKELHKKDEPKDESQVWRYCSLEGQKPVTVKDSKNKEYEVKDTSPETIGKKNEEDLISALDSNNNKFWEIQEKAFFKATDGLGSKASSEIFKKLYQDKSGTLRESCQEAYKKSQNNSETDSKDVLLFCSLLVKSN